MALIAWLAAVAGVAGAAFIWAVGTSGFFAAWLAGLFVFLGWPLGSLALLMVHALTGGRWGEALRPALRAGVRTMPLLLPGVLPLLPGLHRLYPWMQHHAANAFWLNRDFFLGRLAFYLLVWFALGLVALRTRAVARIAPIGLALLALTASFASIDLVESLDPGFSSAVFPMIVATGQVLLALSLATLLMTGQLPPGRRADLGRLMLGLAIFWTYLDVMQFLIVWQSDLASEAPWYARRMRDGWGAAMAGIAVLHLLVPFALLLSPRWQRNPAILRGVAAALVLAGVLRTAWLVLPDSPAGLPAVGAAMLAFGGCAALLCRHGLRVEERAGHV
ncbi:hypothetical protein [Rhodopila sp.]|uniref:hypothetical protein n=1 Tax=Rhodopila sp. TaxID=2480087 RepID=UPI002C1344F7|nr:hypothetical protein [Rhodopila sp.]HVZ10295.1 hypothetical protein [Rhodopila sp.]